MKNIEREELLDIVKNTDRNIYVMYHRDMDGIIGGAQIYHFLRFWTQHDMNNISFIGCQYKEDYVDKIKDKDSLIIFIDFSPTREEAEKLLNEDQVLMVIDHHIGAIKKLEGLAPLYSNYICWLDNTRAGCGLAHELFIAGSRENLEFDRMTILSDYAEDRDLWKFELPDSKEINVGLLELFESLEMSWYDIEGMWNFLNNTIEYEEEFYSPDSEEEFMGLLCALGRNKLKYDKKYVNKIFKAAEKGTIPKINIGGVKMFCLNNKTLISETGNKLTELDYPSCQYFVVHNVKDGLLEEPKVVLSFRSTDELPDVRLVALSLGGDGHRNACGAEITVDKLSELLAGKL